LKKRGRKLLVDDKLDSMVQSYIVDTWKDGGARDESRKRWMGLLRLKGAHVARGKF
jgi:hypothetical protein